MLLSTCALFVCTHTCVSAGRANLRSVLRTVEALSDLGPQLTAEREFPEIAQSMLAAAMEAAGAAEGVLFTFNDRPSLLTSYCSRGFAMLPEPAVIPLLPKHVHGLTAAPAPLLLHPEAYENYLSANGNVAPELFRCLAPLRVGRRLVGAIILGRRAGDALYEAQDIEALGMLANYIALAVHNRNLTETLSQRVSENLRTLGSIHGFYDNALEAFAAAIDVKHVNIQGHSLRVGRYAAAIGESLGLDAGETTALRSAGYLHDIGKVAVDKYLFGKTTPLDPEEFRAMADHTVVGHQIVSNVHFPWPRIPEIVRWHHERGDGSGYPDGLHMDEISLPVRIVGLADTFDAMTSARPYREPLSVGSALREIVHFAPAKFDPAVVQALLVQVRRDAVGSNRIPFMVEDLTGSIAANDVDMLAATLQHKVSNGRLYLT
jgi:putative nucleotidyltransferase with HDIG domain